MFAGAGITVGCWLIWPQLLKEDVGGVDKEERINGLGTHPYCWPKNGHVGGP